MNKVILIGNLTKDPDVATTTSGVSVCKFSLAVQRKFENADGVREADFINIVVWRKLAENCGKFLAKGRKCAVVGSLQTKSYDAQDGSKKYITEVIAEEVEFLGSKPQEDAESVKPELIPIECDDLPF